MAKVMYMGIDVDDKAFHGCGIVEYRGSNKMVEFKTKPSVGALMQKIGNFRKEGYDVRICYEATYLGFTLARELRKRKVHCDVIAPSSIPRSPDKTVKTDKIDCRELAEYYKNGQLTVVYTPDETTEQVRDIVRSRFFVSQQYKSLKRHILSTCRRAGLDYRAASEFKSPAFFTHSHLQWLETELNKRTDAELKFNLKMLLSQMRQFENQLSNYDEEIERISKEQQFAKGVEALACYRGIDTLSAMCLITELGDIRRFDHPRKLTSYVGMDLREYTSGGKERRYSMSKMGNTRIRTSAVESVQKAHLIPTISKRLKDRRQNTDPKYTEIADRCMKRLYKKSTRMLYAGKPINKIKGACARELLCFVWESLNLAAAA